MEKGTIVKALGGFYYITCGEQNPVECRARGKLRLLGEQPLVGDDATFERTEEGHGSLIDIVPRKNCFIRPAVANIELLIVMAAAVNPVTDPFVVDMVTAIAEHADCDCVICVNKTDMDAGDVLFDTYSRAGFTTIRTSAVTGEGIAELREAMNRKKCAFTGNSGVGKSSVLNAIDPRLAIKTGEVSERLGRGRHTTRHVELFDLGGGTFAVDTPGFSSFDAERVGSMRKEELQYAFRDFTPFLGGCRFLDCAHIKEPDCAVLKAVERGDICKSRHNSYVRLYEMAAQIKDWQREDK